MRNVRLMRVVVQDKKKKSRNKQSLAGIVWRGKRLVCRHVFICVSRKPPAKRVRSVD